jgi:hypothetical protein
MDAWRAGALATFPYECLQVPGTEALATWQKLKAEGRGVPIVLGDDFSFDQVLRALFDHATRSQMSKDQVLARAKANLEAAATLRHPEDLRLLISRQVGAAVEQPPLGPWPTEAVPSTPDKLGLTIALDESDEPFPKVHVALIPARDAADVPAYLNYGGWNACPAPEYQVAALRSWRDRYGAELIGLGSVMNLRVPRPPAARGEALELAREHFDFCRDIFNEADLTLSDMAASLKSERWWNFIWWE